MRILKLAYCSGLAISLQSPSSDQAIVHLSIFSTMISCSETMAFTPKQFRDTKVTAGVGLTGGKRGHRTAVPPTENALFSKQLASVTSQNYWINDGPPLEGATLRRMQINVATLLFSFLACPSPRKCRSMGTRRRLFGDMDHLFAPIFSFSLAQTKTGTHARFAGSRVR